MSVPSETACPTFVLVDSVTSVGKLHIIFYRELMATKRKSMTTTKLQCDGNDGWHEKASFLQT